MKKRPAPLKDREKSKLKAQLVLRERQVRVLTAACRAILRFESARLSVFESEVHQIQRMALTGLVQAERAHLGEDDAGEPLATPDKRLAVIRRLNKAAGAFPLMSGAADAIGEE